MENTEPKEESKIKKVKNWISSYFVIRIDQAEWLRTQSYYTRKSMSLLMREALDLYIAKQKEDADPEPSPMS